MTRRRMSRFELFIGVWNTTGEVLATEENPAGELIATDTYRWLPGEHFIVHDVDARFDGKPTRSMEVIGYDAARRHHFSRSFDDMGRSDLFLVALSGGRWTIRGEKVRFNGGFNVPKNRLAGRWDIKTRRAGWQPWIDLELVRA